MNKERKKERKKESAACEGGSVQYRGGSAAVRGADL